MDDNEPTNLAEADEPTPEVETEVEPQLDDDGNPIEEEPEPEEEEEVDLDDLKLKLPKSQAEKLRQATLRQADYTRKTQALADKDRAFEAKEKAFEADRETYQQASQQEQTARANLTLIDGQIAQYSQVNWAKWTQDDPFAAQEAFQQFTLLKDARGQTAGYLNHLTQERTSKEQQADAAARADYAKLMEQGTPAIKAQIKDWGPAKATKLVQDAMTHYGFTREEMTGLDERIILALNDAVSRRADQAKAKKAQSVQQQQEVQPAAKVGRSTAPPAGLDDRLGPDEWLKRRNAQLQKRV